MSKRGTRDKVAKRAKKAVSEAERPVEDPASFRAGESDQDDD